MDFLTKAKQAYQITTHQPNKEVAEEMEWLGLKKRNDYPKWEAISHLPRVEKAYGETELEAVQNLVDLLSK